MGKKVKCWVCGKPHDYCPTCGQTHGWKYVADTIECYQIFMILEDYRSGVTTKKQAAEVLSDKCGITADSNLSWMIPQIAEIVREIVGEKEKIIKTTKKSKLFDK